MRHPGSGGRAHEIPITTVLGGRVLLGGRLPPRDVLLFVLGAVTAFVALAGAGRTHLDAEVPMRVPAVVAMNLFPILAALGVIALPAGAVSRSVGYFTGSFLATATYVVCLAGLIRVARALR